MPLLQRSPRRRGDARTAWSQSPLPPLRWPRLDSRGQPTRLHWGSALSLTACPEPPDPGRSPSPISTCSILSKSLLSMCAWPQKHGGGWGSQAGSLRRAPVPAEEAEMKTSTGAEKWNHLRRGRSPNSAPGWARASSLPRPRGRC